MIGSGKFDPSAASESLFRFLGRAVHERRVYGVFDGDVLQTWTCGRRLARKFADEYGLTYRYLGIVRPA